MSGPKKADVQAALNVVQSFQAECAIAAAQFERKAYEHITTAVTSGLEALDSQIAELKRQFGAVSESKLNTVGNAASEVRRQWASTQASMSEAEALFQQAAATRREADLQFHQASEEFNQAGEHNLHKEMASVQRARALYARAEQEFKHAAQARQSARRQGIATLSNLQQTDAALVHAQSELAQRAQADQFRSRIEAECGTAADANVKELCSAMSGTIERLADMAETFKISDTAVKPLRIELAAAQDFLTSGKLADAQNALLQLQNKLSEQESLLLEKQLQRKHQTAAAETALGHLAATVKALDTELIKTWSDDVEVLKLAEDALAKQRLELDTEQKPHHSASVEELQQRLADALNSALANQAANKQRCHIGDAVMASLADLGFEVSYQPGTRSEPMKIAAQTPDLNGRGDFDVAIPLTGEIDFEVNIPEGDASCVGTLNELRQRLAERGIQWTTTDWGHAGGTGDHSYNKTDKLITVTKTVKSSS